jgi:hypothetical protein
LSTRFAYDVAGRVDRDNKRLLSKLEQLQKAVDELRGENKKLTKMIRSARADSRRDSRILQERERQQRMLFDQQLLRLSSAYQQSLAVIRQEHARHADAVLGQIKAIVKNTAEESMAHLGEIADLGRSQSESLRTLIQQEMPVRLLEILNSNDEHSENGQKEMDRMLEEISRRDVEIQQASSRIRALELQLASKQRRTLWRRNRRETSEPYKEETSDDPQQEILQIIREIAQERNRIRKSEDAESQYHFGDSFGSRLSKTA